MPDLYPDIRPYVTHTLRLDTSHSLYVEECGSPGGIPAVFLHGGPGFGCDPMHRAFFDPEKYRLVLLDQRGCGRSQPHAEISENTTAHLVADLERVRERLGIDRWLVFGGSWGSTLALVYAQTHPDRVTALVLRGIFLCRPRDIAWFYMPGGASRLFPDAWQDYVQLIPQCERHDMVAAYHRRLIGEDELVRLRAARSWCQWEGRASFLQASAKQLDRFTEARTALALARIESHYFVNDCFLEPDQILRNAAALRDIPGIVVHGRYDMPCPLDQAWELKQAWPAADLRIIGGAGHAITESGIRQELVAATIEMAGRLR